MRNATRAVRRPGTEMFVRLYSIWKLSLLEQVILSNNNNFHRIRHFLLCTCHLLGRQIVPQVITSIPRGAKVVFLVESNWASRLQAAGDLLVHVNKSCRAVVLHIAAALAYAPAAKMCFSSTVVIQSSEMLSCSKTTQRNAMNPSQDCFQCLVSVVAAKLVNDSSNIEGTHSRRAC